MHEYTYSNRQASPQSSSDHQYFHSLPNCWSTAKRQSHHSPVSFQTPQCKRRIQYVISLSSLMVLPNLNAHASRPKILQNFAKFHWISSFCMVRSRKKQCSVSIFCCTLQCNRGTGTIYNSNLRNYPWICPICMAVQQGELCFSLVLHSTSQWNCAEALPNAELCYLQESSSKLRPL